jgi:hypothetical protein
MEIELGKITLEDFKTLAEQQYWSWEKHFEQWCKTNRILVKHIFKELSEEDAKVVNEVLDSSPYYSLAYRSLKLHPNRKKYSSDIFAETMEQTYKLMYRDVHQKFDNFKDLS